MTRKEIKNTPEIVDYLLDESLIGDSREKLHNRMDKICYLAIKALEQESIIDKIRAEVEAIDISGQVDEHTMFVRSAKQIKQMVLEIIDKYQSERV